MSGWGAASPVGVARLGFGVSGPLGTPLVSVRATELLILRAYELGVRFFDTAPSYGDGEAERRLGAALRRLHRWQCIVSTKAGVFSGNGRNRVRDFSPGAIKRSLDESMKRLGLHTVDFLFLHGPAPSELTDELLATLEAEKFAGRIGALGCVGRGEELDAALSSGVFTAIMTPVHPNLSAEAAARVKRIREAGVMLVGVECLTPALARVPAPVSAGAFWRTAKWLAGRTPPAPRRRMSSAAALNWAVTEGGAHQVMVTTTRRSHLEADAAALVSTTAGLIGAAAPTS